MLEIIGLAGIAVMFVDHLGIYMKKLTGFNKPFLCHVCMGFWVSVIYCAALQITDISEIIIITGITPFMAVAVFNLTLKLSDL